MRRGWQVNPKRVYRLYREEHLAARRLKRKRIARPAQPISTLTRANQEWAMDFVMDSLASGRGYRTPDEFAAQIVPTSRPFAVEAFATAACSVRQGNPPGSLRSALTHLRSGQQQSSTTAKRLNEALSCPEVL